MARKLTSQMTAVELAKVFADHHGYFGAHGGWIYRERHTINGRRTGQPVCQGGVSFARLLEQRCLIRPGRGIDWILVPRGVQLP
jgi:hypothetical protein